jgi:hypothetical protein
MLHVALVTTSYPDQQPGSEAAGSFVEDFAHALSEHARVTVIAASTADSVLALDLVSRWFASWPHRSTPFGSCRSTLPFC